MVWWKADSLLWAALYSADAPYPLLPPFLLPLARAFHAARGAQMPLPNNSAPTNDPPPETGLLLCVLRSIQIFRQPLVAEFSRVVEGLETDEGCRGVQWHGTPHPPLKSPPLAIPPPPP